MLHNIYTGRAANNCRITNGKRYNTYLLSLAEKSWERGAIQIYSGLGSPTSLPFDTIGKQVAVRTLKEHFRGDDVGGDNAGSPSWICWTQLESGSDGREGNWREGEDRETAQGGPLLRLRRRGARGGGLERHGGGAALKARWGIGGNRSRRDWLNMLNCGCGCKGWNGKTWPEAVRWKQTNSAAHLLITKGRMHLKFWVLFELPDWGQ